MQEDQYEVVVMYGLPELTREEIERAMDKVKKASERRARRRRDNGDRT